MASLFPKLGDDVFYQTIEDMVAYLITHPNEVSIQEHMFGHAVDELNLLLAKIRESEDFVRRAELYFQRNSHRWSDAVAVHFEVFLERKRDQILYEKERAERMGQAIALRQYPRGMDEME